MEPVPELRPRMESGVKDGADHAMWRVPDKLILTCGSVSHSALTDDEPGPRATTATRTRTAVAAGPTEPPPQ